MALPWLDLTLPSAAENLALDEALLLEAECGNTGEVLRVWEWAPLAVVLGAGGKIAHDVDEAACAADGVPVVRRASGGGTVLLGRGCMLYSLVLRLDREPALRDINASYGYILGRMRTALGHLAPGIELAGISDLAIAGRKFSGNAQQRKRAHLLHHGTLLYAFDLGRIGHYLRMPEREPSYRRGRDHDHFMINLPAEAGGIRHLLQAEWEAEPTSAPYPEERVRDLLAEKYHRPEWNLRR